MEGRPSVFDDFEFLNKPDDGTCRIDEPSKPGEIMKDPIDQTHWVWATRESDDSKFYFQHLSEDQMGRFIELLNGKKLKIGYPGYFYQLPYFIAR